MKHATTHALEQLADFLEQIRLRQGLNEKRPGVFYRKSKAFLHFHEDPAGTFADLKLGAVFERFAVNTAKERQELLAAIDRSLADW